MPSKPTPQIAAAIAVGCLAVALQGCGGGGKPTPAPTPPPTPSQPTPPPSPGPSPKPLPAEFCQTAECCKKKAQHSADQELCDDFYNTEVGIAVSMISVPTWQHQGDGYHGMDKAFFNADPPTTYLKDGQEAMSLTHYQKGLLPYGAASAYGVVLAIGPNSNFWQFFQQNKKGELCAQCEDGFHCAPDQYHRRPLNMSFEEFQRQKSIIVDKTGTSKCHLSNIHAYNEFDTNGLSSSALAGVFIDDFNLRRTHVAPKMADVCKFMKFANPNRTTPWPVYTYLVVKEQSSLAVTGYLECDTAAVVV